MKKLYKKILKDFLKVYVEVFLILIAVYLAADFLTQISEFMKEKSPPSYVFLYYLSLTPSLLIQLSPLGIVITLWMTLGEMIENRELLALETSGISFRRIVFPLFILVFLISSIFEVLNLNIVPSTRIFAYRVWKGKIQGSRKIWEMREKRVGYQDREGRIVYITGLHVREGKIEGLEILYPDSSKRLEAHSGWWKKKYWELNDVVERDMKTGKIKERKKMRINYLLSPYKLWKIDKPSNMKSLSEILSSPKYRVNLWHRFFFPWSGFVLLCFSLIIIENASFLSLSKRLFITFTEAIIFYGFYYFLLSFMEKGKISPLSGYSLFIGIWIISGFLILTKK